MYTHIFGFIYQKLWLKQQGLLYLKLNFIKLVLQCIDFVVQMSSSSFACNGSMKTVLHAQKFHLVYFYGDFVFVHIFSVLFYLKVLKRCSLLRAEWEAGKSQSHGRLHFHKCCLNHIKSLHLLQKASRL